MVDFSLSFPHPLCLKILLLVLSLEIAILFFVTGFSFYYLAKAGLPINFLLDPWESEFVVSSGGAGSCLLLTSIPCWMVAVCVLWALSSGNCRIAIPFTEILMPGPWAEPLGALKQSFQLSWAIYGFLWTPLSFSFVGPCDKPFLT